MDIRAELSEPGIGRAMRAAAKNWIPTCAKRGLVEKQSVSRGSQEREEKVEQKTHFLLYLQSLLASGMTTG